MYSPFWRRNRNSLTTCRDDTMLHMHTSNVNIFEMINVQMYKYINTVPPRCPLHRTEKQVKHQRSFTWCECQYEQSIWNYKTSWNILKPTSQYLLVHISCAIESIDVKSVRIQLIRLHFLTRQTRVHNIFFIFYGLSTDLLNLFHFLEASSLSFCSLFFRHFVFLLYFTFNSSVRWSILKSFFLVKLIVLQ